MQEKNLKKLVEGLRSDNVLVICSALDGLLVEQDEDLLTIALRELAAAGLIVAGSKTAIVIGDTILVHEPKHSLLAKFARKLKTRFESNPYNQDGIVSQSYPSWIDNVLAKNIDMSLEDYEKEWSNLEDVVKLRQIIATT